jgi:hypothetical protein
MEIPEGLTLKGRAVVTMLRYYHCECGWPECGLILTSFEGDHAFDGAHEVLLTPDGAIFKWRRGFELPSDMEELAEVAAHECAETRRYMPPSGPHVIVDWRFKPCL